MNELLMVIKKYHSKKAYLIFLTLLIVVNLILIILYNHYSLFENKTCHSGVSGLVASLPFILGLLVSATSMIVRYKRKLKYNLSIERILFVICIAGIVNIIAFERLNVMMGYDRWIKKGMPEKFESISKQ